MQNLAQEPSTGYKLCRVCGVEFNTRTCSLSCPHPNVLTDESAMVPGSRPRDGNHGTIEAEDFVVLSLADLNAQDLTETPWLIEGVLSQNGVGSMVGKPKVGKSTLLRNLAACVVKGNPWLGRDCLQGPVLYITFEDDELTVREHAGHLGLVDGDEFYFVGRPRMPDKIAPLLRAIEKFKPVLTIVDPLALFLAIKDGNSYHEVYKALAAILDAARDTETAILLSHHERKSGGEHGTEALGSTAFFGAVDCQLHIERDNDGARFLKSEQRRGDPFEKTGLEFDKGTGVMDLGELAAEMRNRDLQEEVLAFINSADTPVKVREIRDAVTGRSQEIGRAIDTLLEEGAIQSEHSGRARLLSPGKY